jgi:hypothetical protein
VRGRLTLLNPFGVSGLEILVLNFKNFREKEMDRIFFDDPLVFQKFYYTLLNKIFIEMAILKLGGIKHEV